MLIRSKLIQNVLIQEQPWKQCNRLAVLAVLLFGGWNGCGESSFAPRPIPAEFQCNIFPADNPWNQAIDNAPIHPRSADYISSLGLNRNLHPDFGTVFDGAPLGIPFAVVNSQQTRVEVNFEEANESDPGPYPVPANAPIEAASDRHVIVLNDDDCELFELFDASKNSDNSWNAFAGARFDLKSNVLRPDRTTSADAAGLPIFPGLARYQEVVVDGAINHALRVTARRTQNGFIHPATHASGSGNSNDPPMGLRLRLRSNYDCSDRSQEVQVMCTAFKTYGLIVADNGSSWFVSGAPDPRWDDDALRDIKSIPGSAFEAIDSGPIIDQN